MPDANAEPNADNAPYVDVLIQMIERLPPGAARQLFDKLYQECDRLLTILRDESLGLEETVNTAHEFKGMLGNFGLSNASAIAAEIEQNSKPARSLDGEIQRLEIAIAEEMQKIEAILQQNDS